jgi:hypothetical protein
MKSRSTVSVRRETMTMTSAARAAEETAVVVAVVAVESPVVVARKAPVSLSRPRRATTEREADLPAGLADLAEVAPVVHRVVLLARRPSMMGQDNTTAAMSSAKDAVATTPAHQAKDAVATTPAHQEPRVALAVKAKKAARDAVVAAEAETVAAVVAIKAALDPTRASMAVLAVVVAATVAAEVVPAVAVLQLSSLSSERDNFPRGLCPLESFC